MTSRRSRPQTDNRMRQLAADANGTRFESGVCGVTSKDALTICTIEVDVGEHDRWARGHMLQRGRRAARCCTTRHRDVTY